MLKYKIKTINYVNVDLREMVGFKICYEPMQAHGTITKADNGDVMVEWDDDTPPTNLSDESSYIINQCILDKCFIT